MRSSGTFRFAALRSRARRGVLGVCAAAIFAALPANASADAVVEGPYVTGAYFQNCQTNIWAPHATSNSRYYRHATRHPQVGEVFYMAVWVIGNNTLCPAQTTKFEFAPPAGTRLAISSQHPMRCSAKPPNQSQYGDTRNCPQSAYGSWFDRRIGLTWYAFKPTTQSAFALPRDGALYIEVPLEAVSASTSTRAWVSARTNYGPLTSYVDVRIDPAPAPSPMPDQQIDCGGSRWCG